MTDGALFVCTFVIAIWFGWPIHTIAEELVRIRKLAERGRR